MQFEIQSDFKPTGDQPRAIEQLVKGITDNERYQVLLGVTGSGKTFTVANVIERVQKPTLVLAHNKTLAGQLYSEFKQFCNKFTSNAYLYIYHYTTFASHYPCSKIKELSMIIFYLSFNSTL